MLNKKLEYMLSNDPNVTLSERGTKIRKIIRPAFIQVLKLGNKLKLTVEKNEFVKKDNRPIIYVVSHGFKDDVINTISTTKAAAYIIVGNIDLFFNTFDGTCLWIYGCQLVDRYNEESKHAMKNKMNRIMELGNDIMIFPEATWNLSPNRPMENFHAGFYDVALKNNAIVVPVLTHKVGNKCYSRVLKSIDINEFTEEDIYCILNSINKLTKKASDILSNHLEISNDIVNSFIAINDMVDNISNNMKIEDGLIIINKIEEFAKANLFKIKNYIISINDYTYSKDLFDREITLEVLKRIELIMKRISMIKKVSVVKKIRDIMAIEKVDMYRQNPDYSYMIDGKNMYEAWEDYLKDTISATPYFYAGPESTTVFKDPLVDEYEDVMKLKK